MPSNKKKVVVLKPKYALDNKLLGKLDKQMAMSVLCLYGKAIRDKLLSGDSYLMTFHDKEFFNKKMLHFMVVQMKNKKLKYILEPRLKVAVFTDDGMLNRNKITFKTDKNLERLFGKIPIRERYQYSKE